MLYIYRHTDNDCIFTQKAQKYLSRERIEKMNKYRLKKDQELCCLSFLLLRYALYSEYGISDIPDIITGKYGKPYLRNKSAFFNISHCDNSVLCSLSRFETGCDVQDYSNEITEIADDIMTENEKIRTGYSVNDITRLWTLKEAYGKYKGFGLGYDYAEKDFSAVAESSDIQSFEGLKVYSRCFDDFAVSSFSHEPLEINHVSFDSVSELFM